MKILIVSQYFWPENFKINDLALALKSRGYEVVILTGMPNYPQGSFFKGYGFFGPFKDSFKGIRIYRVPVFPRGKGGGAMLLLNYVSFVFFGSIFILGHRKKYDLSITYAISPITQVFPALVHKLFYKSKLFIWLQDLWPESVVAAGKVNAGLVMFLLNKMVRTIYKNCDKVLVQSEAFTESVMNKGMNKSNIHYIPNWAEDVFTSPLVLADSGKFNLPVGFKIVFAGNIGEAQDFDSLLNAASLTKDFPDIKWVFVGNGRRKQWVQEQVISRKLEKTVFLPGSFPLEDMPALYAQADLLLISLKDKDIFSLTIPVKLQPYMASGKPIAGMLNGVGAELINKADCGFACPAGDYASLSGLVIKAYQMDRKSLSDMGVNGKNFHDKNFQKERILDKLTSLIDASNNFDSN